MLKSEEKQRLVRLARHSVEAQVEGRSVEDVDAAALPEASGVFVTLRIRGELRGCLGSLQCRDRLADEVARCAADAASQDPRFHPVTPGELPDISVEISVLGPLEPVDPTDPGAIEIGVHGLVVERGKHRGLLLPQVATEWSWTRDQFLRQTCVKAELPPDAWRRGATVYRFTAEVFGD